MSTCTVFWSENPAILWEDPMDFFPFHERAKQCTTIALNSFSRFGLYLGVLLALLTQNMRYLILSIGILVLSVAAYYGMKQKGTLREGFVVGSSLPAAAPVTFSMPGVPMGASVGSLASSLAGSPGIVKGIEAAGKPVDDVIGRDSRSSPTGANPFMNVLLTEIGDNPTRPPAENGEFLKQQFSDEFQTRVYGDPTDVFQRNQNQRLWAVNPGTSIPNDRESYQNWLFRVPGRTCKEGNTRVCKTGTEGGTVTWLSQA
jgi:hypothetical protein